MKFHDEGMRDLLHDISFNLCVVHLVRLHDKVLLQCLYSVDGTIVFLFCHVDFSEATTADHFKELEIFYRHGGLVA